MNPDVLLNRIRLEQRGLIDIHKKLYEMEHLLPAPDPMQFAKTAESAAILSEKSTAHLRNMFFSVSSEPPIYYYPKAAEVQGIRVWADTNYLRVLLPALLPDKKKRDGCKFLLLPLQAALVQSGSLPHFSDCVICVEHIYDRNLPIKAVRDYDNQISICKRNSRPNMGCPRTHCLLTARSTRAATGWKAMPAPWNAAKK